jgi:2-haloacid dehalogenase
VAGKAIKPQSGSPRDGMCWGAVAMKREAAVNRRSFVASLGIAALGATIAPLFGNSGAATKARETVLVFDVADTLLNIQALGPFFDRIFGDPRVADEWFGQSILYAETVTVIGSFVSFGSISQSVFRMLAKTHGVTVTSADVDELGQRLGVLPPHGDVAKGLDQLKTAGFRMVTLTNTPANPNAGPLVKAGLADYFERNFSAEAVKRFKPAAETYRMVADQLGRPISSLCMVAAHPWDLIGAQTAGCSAALIARSDVAVLPLRGSPVPAVIGKDLVEVAKLLTKGATA